MPCLFHNGRNVETDYEKAELLNRTFTSKFSDPSVNVIPSVPDYDIGCLSSFDISEDLVRFILLSTNRTRRVDLTM